MRAGHLQTKFYDDIVKTFVVPLLLSYCIFRTVHVFCWSLNLSTIPCAKWWTQEVTLMLFKLPLNSHHYLNFGCDSSFWTFMVNVPMAVSECPWNKSLLAFAQGVLLAQSLCWRFSQLFLVILKSTMALHWLLFWQKSVVLVQLFLKGEKT